MQQPDYVPLNSPSRKYMGRDDLSVGISKILVEGPYLNGDQVRGFETEFATFLGAKHCIAVSSGTAALELAFVALELPPGSEVLLPANAGGYGSFAAIKANLTPTYYEVGPNGEISVDELDINDLRSARAIVITHLYGFMVNMAEVLTIAASFNLIVVEDCAQSTGANISGKFSGTFGDVSTFSFYPTKNLAAAGDAGAVVTNSPLLFEKLNSLRQYGWKEKYCSEIPEGRNSRMDEFQAFILRSNLKDLVFENVRRREIWSTYNDLLIEFDQSLIGVNSENFVAHLAVLKVSDRSNFQEVFQNQKISTGIHFPFPDYSQPALLRFKSRNLPRTERLCREVVSVPLFPTLTDSEVERVLSALKNALGG